MINMMIVEDEPPTLRRIQALVERLDPMFLVAATALNGKDALERLFEIQIDVVLTDIRMPVMDGMELMDRIKEINPDCIIVVLSGYQDYEYMSHAIRARSLDYLLKPISQEQLKELLGRIKEQYLHMSHERLSRSLSIQLNKSTPGEDKVLPSGSYMGVCLFCAGNMPYGNAEMHPGLGIWSGKGLEALAKRFAQCTTFSWEFMGNTPVERILIFQTELKTHKSWLKLLHEAILENVSMPVSCACLSESVPLEQIDTHLNRLHATLSEHIRIGHSLFQCLPPNAEIPLQVTFDDRELINKLAELLIEGRIAQNNPLKREIFQRIEIESWTQRRVTELFLSATNVMEQDVDKETQKSLSTYREILLDMIETSLSLEELEDNISSMGSLTGEDAPERLLKQARLLDAVERYMRVHYSEHITIQQLATEFGYVPSYLSLLFRQRNKQSLSDFLTQIRISEAKRLMRENPGMLVREVAEQVGFKSYNHFSRIFKKVEGMRPSSYTDMH